MANRHDDDAREPVRQFRLTRHATVKRLCRVNRSLSAWDEHEAARARPDLFPGTAPPTVSRAALKSLQQALVAAIAEQEAAWERRN